MAPRDPSRCGTHATALAEHLAASIRAAGDEVTDRVVALHTEGRKPVPQRNADEEAASSEAVEKAKVALATLKATPEQRTKLKRKRWTVRAKMLEEWGLYRPPGHGGLQKE